MNSQSNTDINNSNDLSNDSKGDISIIDITGESTKIIYNKDDIGLVRYPPGIPIWEYKYIYSFNELRSATPQQVDFYLNFKKMFLLDTFLDLEGNINYAFILLFDLLNDFKMHQDLPKLEKQMLRLSIAYPKVRAYSLSMLSLVMEEKGDLDGIERLRDFQQNSINDYSLKLGNKFRKELRLSELEVELLNRIWYPDNNFCNIEFCLKETVKLFLLIINAIDHRFRKEGMVAALEFNTLADFITHRKLGAGINNYNYKYTMLAVLNDIYTLIFKYTENAVREAYGHSRKLNTELHYQDADILALFETRLINSLNLILPVWISRIEKPDEATEIELFKRNTTRWKVNFQNICEKHGDNAQQFYEQIGDLAVLNIKNPSVEMIWFEAARFISKNDNVIALKLYLHYIAEDLKSVEFDNRKLNKTIQKGLFHTEEQLEDFEHIVNNLIGDLDLEKALEAATHIYQPKRKKIVLNQAAISRINEKYSGTVELLSRYLDDEVKVESSSLLKVAPEDEVTIRIITAESAAPFKIYNDALIFSNVQTEVLEMFRKGNFIVQIIEFEEFAKAKGEFRNQLIDRINELCYDFLDDILIEEEADNYIINEDYYKKILAQ